MRSSDQRQSVVAVLVVAFVAVSTAHAQAQDTMSAALAAELAEIMSAAQLDAVAAKDTEGDDRFVAALAFPGQLLVVSARYEVPIYVWEKISNGQYRDVYIDLNSASIADTKILITDAGADGLAGSGGAVDMYDTGARVLRFDGDPGGQQLSQDDYDQAFSDAETQYSRMLKVLIAQAR
jgi:hypothetical protein